MSETIRRAWYQTGLERLRTPVRHHRVRSMNAAVWLRRQGFENTQSLRGGIDAWSAQIDPGIRRY